MLPALISLEQKINGRVIRERALLFLSVLAVIFLLWSLLVQSSTDSRQKVIKTELETARGQRQTFENQLLAISQAAASDPDLPKKNTIAQLTAELAEMDKMLSGLSQGLVSADQLPQILQEVLTKTGELTLVQLQTLPAQELQLVLDETKELVPGGAGVFKHAVALRVFGSYFQVTKFLQSLEQSQWRFYWERLDYKVNEYPHADIELRVYTLSAEEGLLGV